MKNPEDQGVGPELDHPWEILGRRDELGIWRETLEILWEMRWWMDRCADPPLCTPLPPSPPERFFGGGVAKGIGDCRLTLCRALSAPLFPTVHPPAQPHYTDGDLLPLLLFTSPKDLPRAAVLLDGGHNSELVDFHELFDFQLISEPVLSICSPTSRSD